MSVLCRALFSTRDYVISLFRHPLRTYRRAICCHTGVPLSCFKVSLHFTSQHTSPLPMPASLPRKLSSAERLMSPSSEHRDAQTQTQTQLTRVWLREHPASSWAAQTGPSHPTHSRGPQGSLSPESISGSGWVLLLPLDPSPLPTAALNPAPSPGNSTPGKAKQTPSTFGK